MSTTLSVTFIRHGESTDNVRSIWAGWKDADLSVHGHGQAVALGDFFSTTRFDVIYASTLKRAYQTAMELHKKQPAPQPPFITSEDLREQYFGEAEGHPWTMGADPGKSLAQHMAEGIYPVLTERHEKFPAGESLNELEKRAEKAIQELVMPHVWKAAKDGRKGVEVAVVSHGLCISELISALLKKSAKGGPIVDYRGLQNTAWSRVIVDVLESKEGKALESQPLEVRVTHMNMHEHIDKLKRQKGGIGSSAYDPKQKDIRSFFGGGGEPVAAQEHCESNARDEVGVDM
ncbi:hypothetical protein PILCRDRAFT_813147, partial [Piloderma croceum F 1598]